MTTIHNERFEGFCSSVNNEYDGGFGSSIGGRTVSRSELKLGLTGKGKWENILETDRGRAQDNALASWLLSTISSHLLSQFVGVETTVAVWNKVLQFFVHRSTTVVISLHYKLQSLKKGDDNMRTYLTRIKEVCDALASCDSAISTAEQVVSILKGLSRDYQPYVAFITIMKDSHSLDKNFSDRGSAHASSRDNSGSAHYSSLEAAENVACSFCAKGLAEAHNVTASSGSWVVDSSASHHITPDASTFAKENGVYFEFRASSCCVRYKKSGEIMLRGEERGGLYFFQSNADARSSGQAETYVALSSNKLLSCVLLTAGVVHRVTCPHTSKQNGVVEQKNRHIIELALVLLAQTSMPIKFWTYAAMMVVHLINRLPTKVLQGFSPYESLFHKQPDYSLLKVFGSRCFPHLRPFNRHKLEFRSQLCTFLGVSHQHKGLLCLGKNGQVYVSRHVKFDKWQFPFAAESSHSSCCSSGQISQPLGVVIDVHRLLIEDAGVSGNQHASVHEHERSIAGSTASSNPLEDSNESMCSSGTNVDELVQDEAVAPPGSVPDSIVNHHPMLTCSKCSVYKPKVYTTILDDSVPSNIHDVLMSTKWAVAVHAEYSALIQNRTWSLVELPRDKSVVGCKWLFKLKRNPDDSIHRYKTRLVAKGFSFEQLGSNGTPLVCKLQKALYGLRQAPRKWNDKLKNSLLELRSSNAEIDVVILILHKKFSLKDLGALSFFLDIEVKRTSAGLALSQKKYFMQAPCEEHLVAVKRILRYLAGTLDYGLVFSADDTKLCVRAFSDADWAGDTGDRRSMTGYGVFLAGKLRVSYVPAGFQLANGFTKPLAKASFQVFRDKIAVHQMGTLTSFSFSAVNFRFNSSPIFCERVEVQVFQSRKSRRNLCYLCRGIFSKDVSREKFFRIRYCSGSNNNNKNNNSTDGDYSQNDGDIKEDSSNTASSTESAVTTASPPEEKMVQEKRTSSDLPPSVPSRPPNIAPLGSVYTDFQIDSFKLMELLGPEKVDPDDVKLIKDKLFGYSTFWVTKEEPFGDLGEGILFLGNLRGNREDVFAKLKTQLAVIMGDKYNLFMVEEPDSEAPDPRGGPRVSFGLLSKEVSEPGPTTLWQYVIAILLFFLTIGSSVELGIVSQINRLPPEVVKYFTDPNAVDPPDMELLYPFVDSALPLAYGVLGVLLFHELGHFLAAFPKKVKLSIPFFIPNITLGSFGTITQFKSILPDRSTQVGISLAGPFAAGDLVQVPSMLFEGSLLLGLISRATLGHAAMHATTVSIHPLVIAGWCGLTTTTFNMLPVGCLDGGRAVQGAFGKGAVVGFGLTTYTLLGLGVIGGPLSLPWGLYVLICQRTPEKPCLNDVTEVGTWRKTAVGVAIFLVVLTLLPYGMSFAEELGIGLVSTF
ncbi:putative zinc metalloprotease EGY1 [Hibiscus syriacus]|uniref:Zinc metalloprotease EGY1 n=1 Tax=Hibiscus syriacus TaxID=106335 RepID=A0A6A2Y8F8_HIBSY|nr:putative zinc metalloprotease EGY1 [Hibiscus syriacus]